MTTFVFPDQTEIVDGIRNVIGRVVDFYLPHYTTCSACSLDPVNNTSVNPFCVVCSGLYYIPSYEVIPVTGFISWGFSEQLGWVQGGQLAEGECRVQIKSSATILNITEQVDFVMVDTKKMKIIKKTLRGTPNINRILLDMQELEK